MSEQPDLKYDKSSYVGAFDESTLRKFEKWLNRNGYFGWHFRFDDSYVSHLKKHHGGIPKLRCFRTTEGTEKVITRFQHFATLPPGSLLQDSAVETSWSLTSDRMGDNLMPFAHLFAGDMLCFDYSGGGRPSVVVWFHEQSPPDEEPYTEFVAENFDEFLKKLYELPPPVKDDLNPE